MLAIAVIGVTGALAFLQVDRVGRVCIGPASGDPHPRPKLPHLNAFGMRLGQHPSPNREPVGRTFSKNHGAFPLP